MVACPSSRIIIMIICAITGILKMAAFYQELLCALYCYILYLDNLTYISQQSYSISLIILFILWVKKPRLRQVKLPKSQKRGQREPRPAQVHAQLQPRAQHSSRMRNHDWTAQPSPCRVGRNGERHPRKREGRKGIPEGAPEWRGRPRAPGTLAHSRAGTGSPSDPSVCVFSNVLLCFLVWWP